GSFDEFSLLSAFLAVARTSLFIDCGSSEEDCRAGACSSEECFILSGCVEAVKESASEEASPSSFEEASPLFSRETESRDTSSLTLSGTLSCPSNCAICWTFLLRLSLMVTSSKPRH